MLLPFDIAGEALGVHNGLLVVECPSRRFRRDTRQGSKETRVRAGMELMMNASKQMRIEIEAAQALIEWKSLFGDEVCARAKQLAMQSGNSDSVSLSHYRTAARMALQTLSSAIEG
jgi:hypothetical protein